ncbi:MAG TPA: phosphodiester glycosidase family protein [Thermoanaerobaculia bacterium]|nr:phosphodiester glycosidase family protein [Thermoanaerobaculia bacterium]
MLLLATAAVAADWQPVAPGVDFQEFRDKNTDIFVVRVDLTNDAIRVVGTRESDKGTKVSDYAARTHALAAINGDYFDDTFNPIGMTVGPCGEWDSAKKSKREGYLSIGGGEAVIKTQSEVDPDSSAEDWMTTTVSGWPALVVGCDALTAARLPGSDAFTRAPHPRTAVGLSRDRETLYLVVADGRRIGVPGLTLAGLGQFMVEHLQVCSAINLDGGGSSTMWVGDRVVNKPADGVERPVSNHLAVVLEKDVKDCDESAERLKIQTMLARANSTATTPSPGAAPASAIIPPQQGVPPSVVAPPPPRDH